MRRQFAGNLHKANKRYAPMQASARALAGVAAGFTEERRWVTLPPPGDFIGIGTLSREIEACTTWEWAQVGSVTSFVPGAEWLSGRIFGEK